jgi:hypothetical protein
MEWAGHVSGTGLVVGNVLDSVHLEKNREGRVNYIEINFNENEKRRFRNQ